MTTRERVKRPEPERTQPIRNWWTMFGPPGSVTPPGMPQFPGAPFTSAGDSVSRGVELGYRVIEEYMHQGQETARMLWGDAGRGGPSMPQMDGASQQRMAAMFGSFWDFASMWMAMMGPAGRAKGGPPDAASAPATGSAGAFWLGERRAPTTAPQETSHPQPSGGGPATILTLEIASSRLTEATVDLRPGSARLGLLAHDLRSAEWDERITGVELETVPAEERVIVRLRVPDELKPGVYNGMVLERQTSLPRGTISVRIFPASRG